MSEKEQIDEKEQTDNENDTVEDSEKEDLSVSLENGDEIHSHHHHHHSHHHSHHSHHRHGHRRHHSKSSSNKKNNKFVAFFKKHRSIIVNVISCTVSVILLIVLAMDGDVSKNGEVDSPNIEATQETIKIETSVYTQKIPLANEAIFYYMSSSNTENANSVYKSYSGHKVSLNKGLPVHFTYRLLGVPNGMEASNARLEISEHSDYSDALNYKLDLNDSSVDIYNLKTATKYYYRISVNLTEDCVVGAVGTFETEKSPRILNIQGTENMRDIGGWTTIDGKIIRQGLLYRGTELDGAVESKYTLTDQGLQQMLSVLGVRFDMDLRSASENKSGVDALGNNVVHKYYGVGMYSDILTPPNAEKLKNIFSDLANPDNYPIYVHCTYGRDRTGTVCYLLGALLGMSKEDLAKEYELSAFTDSYVNTPEFNAFVEKINLMEGETINEKVENYLLSIGVTAEEIAAIRTIFLED